MTFSFAGSITASSKFQLAATLRAGNRPLLFGNRRSPAFLGIIGLAPVIALVQSVLRIVSVLANTCTQCTQKTRYFIIKRKQAVLCETACFLSCNILFICGVMFPKHAIYADPSQSLPYLNIPSRYCAKAVLLYGKKAKISNLCRCWTVQTNTPHGQ